MRTQHLERYFGASGTLRDIIIGMSDGLTVPFALAAGLYGAVASTGIIVTAGLAEIAAGAISMGLGGYLAARSDIEHYVNERQREQGEIVAVPEQESVEVSQILPSYGHRQERTAPLSRGHFDSPWHIRLHQRPFHRCPTSAQHRADNAYRRSGGRRRIRFGKGCILTWRLAILRRTKRASSLPWV